MVTRKSKSVERREKIQKEEEIKDAASEGLAVPEPKEENKSKKGLRIVYTNTEKKLFDIEGDSPESRKGLFPVQASVYNPGAVSHKITTEDLKTYPKLKGIAVSGDIVEKGEFEKFVGI